MNRKWNMKHRNLIVFVLIANMIISLLLSNVSYAAIEDTIKENCKVDYYYYDSSKKQVIAYTTLNSNAGAGKKKIIYNETSDEDGTYYEISNEDERDEECSYPTYIYQNSSGEWVANFEDSSTQETKEINIAMETKDSNTDNNTSSANNTNGENNISGKTNTSENTNNSDSSTYYYIPTGQDASKIDKFTYIIYDQNSKTLAENILDRDESKNKTNTYNYDSTSEDGYDIFSKEERGTRIFYRYNQKRDPKLHRNFL